MIQIVEMSVDHIEQIASLERMCFSAPWSKNSIASELDNPLSLWLAAMDGEHLAGYVGSQTVMGETDLLNIAVHPDYRRRGIARELLLALVERLKQRGSGCLTLEVRPSNAAARCLYEKLGFVQVGMRPKYYEKPQEDGMILRKEWSL